MTGLKITADGSHTIYVEDMDEHYHSIHGAFQESEFIFINNGFNSCSADPIDIFEVGFGTGLNALLTATKSESGKKKVNYTTIEKYPLDESLIRSLNHSLYAGPSGADLAEKIHSAQWNTWVKISENFNLRKIHGDMTDCKIPGKYHLIYFDAFGPEKQPEMWTPEIFCSISSATLKEGIFITYSARGELKRNLRDCGFHVTQLPGPPGKRQITRAVKI